MKVAVLICGHVRSWDKESFLNTFGEDVDVFIHTYNNVLMYHPWIEGQYNISHNDKKKSTEDIVSIIGLNPKRIVVEDQSDIDTVSKDFPLNPDTYYQHRKLKLCNSVRLAYETEKDFKYDIVIKTRFDIIYSLNLNDIMRSIDDAECIYISEGPSIYPCDQIFIAREALITELSEKLLDMSGRENCKYNPHEWLFLNYGDKLRVIEGFKTHIIRIQSIL